MALNELLEKINPNTPVNLVLSGGGAKGVAHIALLEYLEQHHIVINSISGSSAGALVGALYTSGVRPEGILQFFKSTPIFRYTWLKPSKAGIFDSEKYATVLDSFVKRHFEELNIPLIITATNIQKGEATYFSQGDLIRPLLASCAVPAVFTPVEINGELYADGGVMDNFPVHPYLEKDFPILGSYASEPTPKSTDDLNSILKVTNHSNLLLLHSANMYKFSLTNHTISFPVGGFGTFDSKSIDQIYATARKYLQIMK